MRSLNRSIATLVACGLTLAVGSAAAQPSEDQRRVRHQIKQANLYLKMKLPDRARELLTETVASEPGRSDPLAWLALGQAYYYERRIDEVGRAVERAMSLGLTEAIGARKWARRFLQRYRKNIGALVLDGGQCEELTVTAKLAAPMVNKSHRALLESAPGWRSGKLVRKRDEKFFLPPGRYRFGETRVQVLAGELARVSADEVGAACPEPPPAVVVDASPSAPPGQPTTETLVQAVPAEAVAQKDDTSWFEDNWVWVLVGAVVVAGGAATVAGVAASGGPDQVSFNPNPSSFRGN